MTHRPLTPLGLRERFIFLEGLVGDMERFTDVPGTTPVDDLPDEEDRHLYKETLINAAKAMIEALERP